MKTIDHFFSEIANAQAIYDHFGYWPSLCDSEILRIVLDRELGFDFTGPKATIDLHWCSDWLTEDPDKRKSSKIVLLFDQVEFGSITEFNHQNATVEFELDTYDCERLRKKRYRIKFGSIGAKLDFTCNAIHVVSVGPFEPTDYFKK